MGREGREGVGREVKEGREGKRGRVEGRGRVEREGEERGRSASNHLSPFVHMLQGSRCRVLLRYFS